MKGAGIALSALVLSCLPAMPQTLVGFGLQPCSKWIEVHRTATAETVAADSWVLGYLTAISKQVMADNRVKGLPPRDVLKGLDSAAVVKLMEQFCTGKPEQPVEVAVAALAAQLIAQRPQ